ncbi:MAG: hypothetical protein KatS3mg105_1602 [Gemmatales bacterium]|nr:MAG: hypothetical protein KatS3mg105_1602 [Gemmatales bacterium]
MIWKFFLELDWKQIVTDTVSQAVAFVFGIFFSWFLLFRRRRQELQRLEKGDSDDILFQMHHLIPVDGTDDECVLIFRNIGPRTTVNSLYDNQAARELVKKLANQTSLQDPLLRTEGTAGFEVLNDALGYIAGFLAISPFERETWLFMMTCEDRKVVRKQCVRCFLIRPHDLERFGDWQWCRTKVRVEKPWHALRIIALHQLYLQWQQEQEELRSQNEAVANWQMPLVDRQMRHERIRLLSVGLNPKEQYVGQPVNPDWEHLYARFQEMGLQLPVKGG